MVQDDSDAAEIAALFEAIRQADREAWRRLVDRLTPTLWAIARLHRLSETDSADVIQGTWLLLIEHKDTIREPLRLRSWLVTTARRECLRLIRARGRQLATEPETVDALARRGAEEEHVVAQAERDEQLWLAFQALDADCRRLLRLTIFPTFAISYAEVSERVGRPIGSLGPTRGRCLDKLREELERREVADFMRESID